MSIGSIIWIACMIIAGVLSMKENARKRAGKPAPEHTVPPFEPATETVAPRPHAAPKPKREKKSAAAPLPGEIGAPAEAEETQAGPSFNLRDAVIYSEILKPKFDE